MTKREFTREEAEAIGNELGVDWAHTQLEEFRLGLAVELEHGSVDPKTDVTGDDPIATAKIALAHLNEFPDYYTRLTTMEMEAEKYWKSEPRIPPRLQNR